MATTEDTQRICTELGGPEEPRLQLTVTHNGNFVCATCTGCTDSQERILEILDTLRDALTLYPEGGVKGDITDELEQVRKARG